MLLSFLDIGTIYLVFHLFGIAIGAGGAFFSDIILFKSIRDGVLTPEEFGFVQLGGRVVWAGLAILVLSGLLLFFLNPEGYLASSKFLAKITIVGIIAINGIMLHIKILPRLRESTMANTQSVGEYLRSTPLVLVLGVTSAISWSSTILLGAISGIPYSYWLIILVYFAVLSAGISFVIFMRRLLFP